jgi:hypothetical protein
MEVLFGSQEGLGTVQGPVETTVETPSPVTQLPAVIPPAAPPATRKLLLGDQLPSFKDVILPRLNITQNIGQLKDRFAPGSLVFNQATLLFVPPVINTTTGNVERAALPPVTLYVIGIVSQRFSECVKGGIGGAIVNTEAEVRAMGGTLDWKEWKLKEAAGMKRFENLDDLLVAIERPQHCQDDGTVFTFSVEDKKLALGLWGLKGTSYTEAMKKTFYPSRLSGCLREGGYPSWAFSITTREKPFQNGNKAWIPICVPKAKSTPAFMEFVRQIIEG